MSWNLTVAVYVLFLQWLHVNREKPGNTFVSMVLLSHQCCLCVKVEESPIRMVTVFHLYQLKDRFKSQIIILANFILLIFSEKDHCNFFFPLTNFHSFPLAENLCGISILKLRSIEDPSLSPFCSLLFLRLSSFTL